MHVISKNMWYKLVDYSPHPVWKRTTEKRNGHERKLILSLVWKFFKERKGKKKRENKSLQIYLLLLLLFQNRVESKRKEINLTETFYNPYLTLLKVK